MTFEIAKSVFHDDFAVQFFDEEHSSDEDRFLLLGMNSDARLLLVCHCERADGDVIRIRSCAMATSFGFGVGDSVLAPFSRNGSSGNNSQP